MRVHFDSSHLFFAKKEVILFCQKLAPTDYFRETKGMRVGEGTQVGDADGWGCSGVKDSKDATQAPPTPPTQTAPAGTPTARD